MTTPKIRNLIRQANKVAASGKRAAAAALYQQILDEDGTQYVAWVGLGDALLDEAARAEAYEKALAINPDGAEALRALAIMRGEFVEEVVDALKEEEKAAGIDVAESGKSADELKKEDSIYPYPVDIAEWTRPDGTMVCYGNHSHETTLRCNRCGRPICQKHFQRTSVGYRCLVCIREIEDDFFTAETKDYIIGTLVAIPLSIIAGILVGLIGGFIGGYFLFIGLFFFGGGIGAAVARLTSRAIGRRRGRYIPYVVAGCVALFGFFIPLLFGNFLAGAIYAFVATSAAYYQLR